MSTHKDLLVEIGTEELPPKALRALMDAFAANVTRLIDESSLQHGEVHAYASPRRLSLLIEALQDRQEDRQVEQKGPPAKIAFDDAGNATPAALAFAKKCGVSVDELGRSASDKGEWLSFTSVAKGKLAAELVPALIERALAALPIPRRMRWGASDVEFVRPIHWVVLLHGDTIIDGNVLGIRAGAESRGHRFHSSGPVPISSPSSYLESLESEGFVIADFARRRDMVREGVEAAAASVGGEVVNGESLYDEVTALVEWPIPVIGSFDASYLQLPDEVVTSTLTGHQRYFPVADSSGKLLAKFITVANLDSKDPDQVRDGNERVIRPRLADAVFFWDNDRKRALADRQDELREVVYQRGLGSMLEKSERTAQIVGWLAKKLNIDGADATRSALLAKCDLLTGLVGEFPDLQGTMGRYYATASGEPDSVAAAIGEQYMPRFAGDDLPQTQAGQLLAVADKMDTLAGIFAIGKKPSGNRDPFGLRRAALGIVRILIECGIDVSLPKLIASAVAAQPKSKLDKDDIAAELQTYISDRLRRYFLDRDSGLLAETFDAVSVRQPESLLDFDRRLAAVQTFARLDQAESLAAANKRIANILRKAGDPQGLNVKPKLLQEDAERSLHGALKDATDKVAPMLATRRYAEALNALADLGAPVDRFFDDVMVMADDEKVRDNRLALLSDLRELFLRVADISRLAIN